MSDAAPLDWLLRRPVRDPDTPVLEAGVHLSRTALESMRRDGIVVRVAAGVYLPRDVADVPSARRAALRAIVPAGRVVGLLAAAWVYGVDAVPDPVELLVERAVPLPRRVDGVRERESPLPASDVLEVDALRLTTPARTAADVARWLDVDTARPVVAALLAAGTTVEEVLAVLNRGRYRNAVRGRALVAEIAPTASHARHRDHGSGHQH